ncbi:MAG: hypothetical protein K0R15_1804 [Clostridiales bacterium]|jgi:hypothetical protein|nr:hypothetical protein [Clostridiales bacterium]
MEDNILIVNQNDLVGKHKAEHKQLARWTDK